MSLTLVGILGIVVLMLILFFLGTPVSFAMAIVGFIGFCYVTSFKAGLNMTGTVFWGTFSNYGLTVIPLFIFMGQIAFYSGISKKLYEAAYRCFGHIYGGLAMATIAACSAFAAICGSNTATAATMTTVAYPEMKKYHYNSKLSLGAIAAGSTLGVVIPPSVVLIIIGLSTEQSIIKLFYGGMGAGICLSLLMIATVYIICKIKPGWGPVGPKSSLKERLKSVAGTYEMVLLFCLVIFGLYFGIFTPTEAGAVGSFLAIVIGFSQKKLKIKDLLAAARDTLRASCMVVTIVAGAVMFGKFLTVTRIPYDIAAWTVTLPVPSVVVLLFIFLIYLIGGCIMDSLALLLITVPIFFPVATTLGYDPLWFGVVITVITTLGAITPPVGATTYVVGAMAKDTSLKDVFKGIAYFIPAYLFCVLLLMIFPRIITFLPEFIR